MTKTRKYVKKQTVFWLLMLVMLTCMSVSVRNLSGEVCRWHRGRRPHLSNSTVAAKWAECGTAVGVCVCVCALPGKRAYQHADHIDWKIGRKKVRRAKPGNLQNERRGLFWCVFAFLSVLVKGELLNGSGGEEHLKLIEALRKTHTRSHNKKKKSLWWRRRWIIERGGGGGVQRGDALIIPDYSDCLVLRRVQKQVIFALETSGNHQNLLMIWRLTLAGEDTTVTFSHCLSLFPVPRVVKWHVWLVHQSERAAGGKSRCTIFVYKPFLSSLSEYLPSCVLNQHRKLLFFSQLWIIK